MSTPPAQRGRGRPRLSPTGTGTRVVGILAPEALERLREIQRRLECGESEAVRYAVERVPLPDPADKHA